MSINQVLESARMLTQAADLLAKRQLFISVGDDFQEYKALIEQYRPNQPLGLPFHPDHVDLSSGRGFWSVARDASGKVVQTQAMKLVDLGDDTLAEHLTKNFRNFPPAGLSVDLEGSWYRPGPGAWRIKGRAYYHGEMWVSPENGSYRGRGIIDILARFAFLSSLLNWNPDYLFGFMPRAMARHGLAEREGYMHVDPLCLSWKISGKNKPLEGNMVYMSSDDIQHIIRVPLELSA